MSSQASKGGVFVDPFNTTPTTVINSILWNNIPGVEITNPSTVSYSDVDGGAGGVGNISSNPMFLNTSAGDYRLQSGSPAIDRGDNTQVPLDDSDLDGDGDLSELTPLDLAGNPRVLDDTANDPPRRHRCVRVHRRP